MENLATAQAIAPPGDLKSKIWSKIQQEQNPEEEKTLSEEISTASSPEVYEIKRQLLENFRDCCFCFIFSKYCRESFLVQ